MRRKSPLFSLPVIIVVLLIVIVAAYYFIFAKNSPQIPALNSNSSAPVADNGFLYSTTDISAPGGIIHAMSADTAEKMELGLGNRPSLPADNGMLFPFAEVGIYQFWMKDMKFPLDIVWIDARKRIVGIERDLSPGTYPNTVVPPSAVMYVLEINAGAAEEYSMATGTELHFGN